MVYLDHAATTPVLPDVLAAMTPYFTLEAGNPSSLHASGRRARRAVEESREQIAQALGCRPSEVLFTAGGTEADNLAVKGLYWARRAADPARRRVVASAVEHHAVLDAVEWLRDHEGAEVTWLPVDRAGRVAPESLQAVLDDDVAAAVAVPVEDAAEREVVGLAAAGGEDDLGGGAVERRGDPVAGLVHRLARPPPARMRRGRVAEDLAEERQHRGAHLGGDRRRRRVVEIDRRAHGSPMVHMPLSGPV